MESHSATPVFIETEDLAKLIDSGDKSLHILDCTSIVSPTDADPILTFRQKHIPK